MFRHLTSVGIAEKLFEKKSAINLHCVVNYVYKTCNLQIAIFVDCDQAPAALQVKQEPKLAGRIQLWLTEKRSEQVCVFIVMVFECRV